MTVQSVAPALPAGFQFSQSSLTDFDTCRRLFYLRWVERLEWPALAGEAGEGLSLGQRFHRLMRQHFVGIDVGGVVASDEPGSPLRAWWEAFQSYPPELPAGGRYAELVLSAPLDQYRLVAKCDLLAVDAGRRAAIVDWKTGARLPLAHYEGNWQSCIYPYLLAEAGAPYWDALPPPAAAIEMIYWFAEQPTAPIRLGYDAAAHAANYRRLAEAIAYIAALPAGAFSACEVERTCARCVYQGYCLRGAGAGEMDADEEADDWDWSDVPDYEY